MKQQVNLYQAELKPRRIPFDATRVALVLAGVMVAITALYAVRLSQVAPLEAQAAAATERLAASEVRVAELRRTHPPAVVDKALKQTLKSRQARLADTRAIAQKLRSGEFGSVDGLSGYLEGFARRHVEGTWLTAVRVQRGGNALGFEGRTLAPELVPAYLDGLREEALFSGRNFSALSMLASDEGANAIRFRVSTAGISAPEDAE